MKFACKNLGRCQNCEGPRGAGGHVEKLADAKKSRADQKSGPQAEAQREEIEGRPREGREKTRHGDRDPGMELGLTQEPRELHAHGNDERKRRDVHLPRTKQIEID